MKSKSKPSITRYILAVGIFVISFLPTDSYSDMSITAYQKNMKSPSKRDMTYFHLEAVGTGITWTNSIHMTHTKPHLLA